MSFHNHKTKDLNYIYRYLMMVICFFCFTANVNAQISFGDRCIGHWEGMMHIYGKGQLRDSVLVHLDVEKAIEPNTWKWKTSYLSKTMPAVKDYLLILKDSVTQTYSTDEGDGIALMDYYLYRPLNSWTKRI